MVLRFDSSPIYRDDIVFMDMGDEIGITTEETRHFSGVIHIKEMDEDCCEDIGKVGEIRFNAYNLQEFYVDFDNKKLDNKSLLFCMDEQSADAEFYYYVFSKGYSKIWKELTQPEIDEIEMFGIGGNFHLVTLDRFFINEEYRNKGIAKYILKNLYGILKKFFNIETFMIVGVCVPDEDDSKKSMLKLQKEVMKKSGFNLIDIEKQSCFYKYVMRFDYEE